MTKKIKKGAENENTTEVVRKTFKREETRQKTAKNRL